MRDDKNKWSAIQANELENCVVIDDAICVSPFNTLLRLPLLFRPHNQQLILFILVSNFCRVSRACFTVSCGLEILSQNMANFRNTRFVTALRRWSGAFRDWIIPRDVNESIRPLLFVFLLLGAMPFRLVGPRGQQRLQPVIIGGIITITYVVVFITSYAATISMPQIFLGYFMPNMFAQFIDRFMITSAMLAVLIMLLGCLIRRHRFVGLINLMSTIDEQLCGLKGRVRHGAALWLVCRRMVFSFIGYFVYVVGSRELLWKLQGQTLIRSWISYFLPHMMMLCFLFKWRTVVHMLHHRYRVLNGVSFWWVCCSEYV